MTLPKIRLRVDPGNLNALMTEVVLEVDAPTATLPLAADKGPVEWMTEDLGEDPWAFQEEVLNSVVDNERTAVPKCHSSGGTRAAAMAALWWMHHYPGGVVYTLAPTWPQVKDLLWRDIEDIYVKARERGIGLGGDFMPRSCRWNFSARRFAVGRSTDVAEQLQGPHADHFLLIIDEASGFNEILEPAVEGMLASGHVRLLMLSQPTKLSGIFFKANHRERANYNILHMDGYKTPNIEAALRSHPPTGGDSIVQALAKLPDDFELPRPYLLRPDWIVKRAAAWGESNPLYQIRVRGKFPKQASDSLISMDWIESAFAAVDTNISPNTVEIKNE